MAGVHAEAVAVQCHGRDTFPGEGVGVAAPDGVGGPHAKADLVGHVGDHLADGGISGDADNGAAHKLTG